MSPYLAYDLRACFPVARVAFVENLVAVADPTGEVIGSAQGGLGFFIAGEGVREERAALKNF